MKKNRFFCGLLAALLLITWVTDIAEMNTLNFLLNQVLTVGIIALVVLLITPLSLVVANFIAKRTYSMFQLQTRLKGEQTGLIDETIGNIKVVRAFGHETDSLEQFDEINERLHKASLRAIFFSSLTNPCTRFVNSVVYAGVGLSGALIAIAGGIFPSHRTAKADPFFSPFRKGICHRKLQISVV